MRFVAIDVETANADMASICSIGVAIFEDCALKSEWYSLIDPDDFFDPVNISIHGISADDVLDAPTLRDVMAELVLCNSWLLRQKGAAAQHRKLRGSGGGGLVRSLVFSEPRSSLTTPVFS